MRLPDAVGNLYQSEDRKDRAYGKAGQLIRSKGAEYRYDSDGNLIEKANINGDKWQYEWNAAGMLKRVIRPDKNVVAFKYDALGRRISKSYLGTTTRWVWDGNVPLHEWEIPAEDFITPVNQSLSRESIYLEQQKDTVITWIFEPDSFSPMGRIQGDKQYSLVTDYLGTPNMVLDTAGNKICLLYTSPSPRD